MYNRGVKHTKALRAVSIRGVMEGDSILGAGETDSESSIGLTRRTYA